MKLGIAIGLATLLINVPASADQLAGSPVKIFSCSVGNKTVSVTAVGKQLIYHYGTPIKEEMSIIGGAGTGNTFWMTQRYAGIEHQLRFKNGQYSYIVYNMEGNGNTGVAGVSGLVVMQGTKTIADKSCSKYTEFSTSYNFDDLPEDTDAYSAM